MLPRTEQLELLRELTSSEEIHNPVLEVLSISQTQYRQNIQFAISNIGTSADPQIKALLTTPWGEFEGLGRNQKIAKAKASEFAIFSLSNPVKSEIKD